MLRNLVCKLFHSTYHLCITDYTDVDKKHWGLYHCSRCNKSWVKRLL